MDDIMKNGDIDFNFGWIRSVLRGYSLDKEEELLDDLWRHGKAANKHIAALDAEIKALRTDVERYEHAIKHRPDSPEG